MKCQTDKEKGFFPAFFDFFDRGFQEACTEKYSIYADIGGQKLELCFPSREQAVIIEKCLSGRILPETQETDARFCFWTEDCTRYIQEEKTPGRWRYRGEDGWLVYVPEFWLAGAKVSSRTFYYCRHSLEKDVPIPYWALSALVYQWAGTAGLLPVHGGVVGIEGNGVLLAAPGGGGKSTLAAACLLAGMEYVADDYLLLSVSDPLTAMPLFSTLKINPDMKERLGIKMPVIWSDASRKGKQLLDVSAFSLCGGLRVRGIVFLSHSNWEEPVRISPISGSTAVRLTKTALQEVGTYEPAVAKAVVARLSGLPAYEMRPGRDLKKNAAMIRTIIEGME